MCGRFTQRYTWNEVHTFLNVFGTPLNLRPRYNIAPTTTVDVVRLDAQGRYITRLRHLTPSVGSASRVEIRADRPP